MPYTTPPAKIKDMPAAAQNIWVEAFNNAFQEYNGDEATANKVAYTAVKNAGYTQNADGKWIKEASDMSTDPSISETEIVESGPTLKRNWTEAAACEYFEEADGEEKVGALKLKLISAGFSTHYHESRLRRKYQRYYPLATLNAALPLAEGMPIYTGNIKDHLGPRRLEDLAGYFKEAHIENGAIVGKVRPLKHKTWLLDLARENPSAFGPSIEANGEWTFGEAEGKAAAIVTKIDNLPAAQLVTNPAAGGAIAGFTESQNRNQRGKRMLEELNEAERGAVMKEAREAVLKEAEFKAKDEEIKTLKEAAEEKDTEIKELKEAAAKTKSFELIEAAMPRDPKDKEKHVLPEVARKRLHEALEGETDEIKIAEAIKDEAEYISELTEAGKVVKNGATKTEDKKAALQEAADAVFGIAKPKKDGGE